MKHSKCLGVSKKVNVGRILINVQLCPQIFVEIVLVCKPLSHHRSRHFRAASLITLRSTEFSPKFQYLTNIQFLVLRGNVKSWCQYMPLLSAIVPFSSERVHFWQDTIDNVFSDWSPFDCQVCNAIKKCWELGYNLGESAKNRSSFKYIEVDFTMPW